MNNADVKFEQDQFVLSGDLDFSNVVRVYQKALSQFNSQATLVFNFADLKTSNSAGIALMVEWLRAAKRQNKQVEFRNVSPQLQAIIKAARLDFLV